jgi:glycosyltransferase involved in cell wall biosynthesis
MRVAHVLVSLSRKSGGLFHSVAGLANAEADMPGMEVDVHGVSDEFTMVDRGRWTPLVPRIHAGQGPAFLGWAPGMRKAVMEGGYDIIHNHGLWQDVSRIGFSWQRRTERPHIVSPRGMLDPWALANSGWKKKLAGAVFENRHLREATCLHALCEAEARSMRAYGLRNPIAVVPNGVALPAQRGVQCSVFSVQPAKEVRTLLFLGRLHPKKGLPEAVRAWAEVAKGTDVGWRLVIAGWDQGGHEAELKKLCGELGVGYSEDREQGTGDRRRGTGGRVIFAGPAFGETKEALLRSADAFILPSLSEGLPMSVLEAWAYGLPVLMTEECNLPEGFAAEAAIRIGGTGRRDDTTTGQPSLRDRSPRRPTDKDQRTKGPEVRDQISEPKGQTVGIATGMRRIMEMTEEERVAMGARGRALVEERFTWPKVAAQMTAVYEWVLGKGPRPDVIQD